MKTAQELLTLINTQLPSAWQEPINELAQSTLAQDSPLRLTLVGGFSVGKSSLLNMLINEKLLFTAKEEATALPTFLEYGHEKAMTLIGSDGSGLPLEVADFERVTTNAPEGAACAVLALPLEWLKNVVVIDLPGLGSMSQLNQSYTLAQIKQSDAILYLIEPRGPTQEDIATLKQIKAYGKRVKIVVTRWDEIEQSVARGEKMPNLAQWEASIHQSTGLKLRIATANHHGHGQDDILAFIERAKEDIEAIRFNRFKAELVPTLQNALGLNSTEQQACQTLSEDAARKLHQDFIQQKQQLTDLKTKLYEQQRQERATLEQNSKQAIDSQRGKLKQNATLLAQDIQTDTHWPPFIEQGTALVRQQLITLADTFSQQSQQYGDLQLPEVIVETLNLRLPAPQAIEASDFLEMAQLNQLQQKLEAQEAELNAKQQQLESMPDVDLSQEEHTLREFLANRNQLASEPLPRIIQRTESSNMGATLGRALGEMADLALIFVTPTTIASKSASIVGKGAKAVNVAVNTKSLAKNIGDGVRMAKAAQLGKIDKIPAPIRNKMGMLEMLSLGYWGEKVGSMFDGGASEVEVVDPQARAERNQAMAMLDKQILQLRNDLACKEDIANERHLTGWALEQSKQEQTRIQKDIERVQQQLIQRQQQAQIEQAQEYKLALQHQTQKAITQWLRNYDAQGTSMLNLLLARVKQYWDTHIDQTLLERVQEIDNLMAQMQAAPAQKQATLAQLKQEATAIQTVLEQLR